MGNVFGRLGQLNRNVQLAFLFTLTETATASIRAGDVLSADLYLLTGSNATVGYVQGINGIMQMAAALPAGWLADHYQRATVLRIAAGIGVLAAAALATALALQLPASAYYLALGLMGAYRGFNNPSVESLFADSVPRGNSRLFTAKWVIMQLASMLGPAVSIVLFYVLGNKWEVEECRVVLLAGLSVMVVPLATLMFFSDEHSLEPAAPGEKPMRQPPLSAPARNSQEARAALQEKLLDDTSQQTACDVPGGSSEASDADGPCTAPSHAAEQASAQRLALQRPAARQRVCCGSCPGCCTALLPRPQLLIPLLITASDFIQSLAAGMTIKFFSLFYQEICLLPPTAVSLLALVSPLCIAAVSLACQALAARVGRLQLSLVTRALDFMLLTAMAVVPAGSSTQQRAVLIALHLVRTAMANGSRPLMSSLLMDHVPKATRGRWNALESVRSFSWSGSAAAGGLLISRFGFQGTFAITALLKLLGVLPLIPLLGLVDEGMWLCCVCGKQQQPAGAEAEAGLLHCDQDSGTVPGPQQTMARH